MINPKIIDDSTFYEECAEKLNEKARAVHYGEYRTPLLIDENELKTVTDKDITGNAVLDMRNTDDVELTLTGSNMSGATEGWTSCFNPTTDISHVEFGSQYSYTAPNNKDVFFMAANTSDTGGAYLDYDVSTDTFTVTNTSQTPATVNQLGWKIKESLVTTVEPYCYIQDTATYTSADGLKPFLIVAYKDASQNANYNSSNMNVWFFGYGTVDITTSTSRVVAGKCTEGATYTDHEYIKDGIHYLIFPVCKGNQYNASFASGSPCTRIGLVTYNLPQGESVWIKGLRFSFVNLPVTVSELTSNFYMTDDNASHIARSASATEMFVERAMDLGYKYEDYTGGLPAPNADYPLTETVSSVKGKNEIVVYGNYTSTSRWNDTTKTYTLDYDNGETTRMAFKRTYACPFVQPSEIRNAVQKPLYDYNSYYWTWAIVGMEKGTRNGIETDFENGTAYTPSSNTQNTKLNCYGYNADGVGSSFSIAPTSASITEKRWYYYGGMWYLLVGWCSTTIRYLNYFQMYIDTDQMTGVWSITKPFVKIMTYDDWKGAGYTDTEIHTYFCDRSLTQPNLNTATWVDERFESLLCTTDNYDYMLYDTEVVANTSSSTVTLTKPEQKADFVSGKITDEQGKYQHFYMEYSGSGHATSSTGTYSWDDTTKTWSYTSTSASSNAFPNMCTSFEIASNDMSHSCKTASSENYFTITPHKVHIQPYVSSVSDWNNNTATEKWGVMLAFDNWVTNTSSLVTDKLMSNNWASDIAQSNIDSFFVRTAPQISEENYKSTVYIDKNGRTYIALPVVGADGRTGPLYGLISRKYFASSGLTTSVQNAEMYFFPIDDEIDEITNGSWGTLNEVTTYGVQNWGANDDGAGNNFALTTAETYDLLQLFKSRGNTMRYGDFNGGEASEVGTCDTLETFYPTTTIVGGDKTKILYVSEVENND